MSNTVASRAMLGAECASEKDTMARLAQSGMSRIISGSAESPDSTAWIWSASSPNTSANESNPVLDPNIPYQGVKACAGMTWQRGSASLAMCRMSSAESFRVGLPSDSNRCTFESLLQIVSAVAKLGAVSNRCTRRTLPSCRQTQDNSVVNMNDAPWAVNMPEPVCVSVSESLNSARQVGCVKSGAAIRSTPLMSAPRARDSTVRLGLVASANLECRCRSAIMCNA